MFCDTYTSLLVTYQQSVSRSENAKLTLETHNSVETVQLTVSRPTGVPAALREPKEGSGWRIPAPPPYGWRTPARSRPGEDKTLPCSALTPPSTKKKKSPSQLKRDKVRSEERKEKFMSKIENCENISTVPETKPQPMK